MATSSAKHVEIRRLAKSDDRSSFHSGDADLDRFFSKYAGQNQFRHFIGTTYVAALDGQIIGYATVSPASIEIDRLPVTQQRKLPEYPIPVLRLARLAVDSAAKGLGVGKLLLRFVLQLAVDMADRFGCVGVVVDAKLGAVSFYERLGFEPLDVLEGASGERPTPIAMFLPLAEIKGASTS